MAQAKRYVDDGLEVDRASEGLQHSKPKDADGLQYHNSQPTSGDEKQIILIRDGNTVPCGLSALLFAILVSVITAVVVGAAVGGGVGGALSGPDYRDNSKTTTIAQAHTVTITSTATLSAGQTAPTTNLKNYAAAQPANVDTLSWDCPGASSYTTSNIDPNANFDITCGIDWAQGHDAVGGGVVADIIGIVAYSADDCMEACANFNMFQAQWSNSTMCAGVTFSRGLSAGYSSYAANCWLKNGTAVSPTSDVNELGAVLVS